jgi:hypothetical protein
MDRMDWVRLTADGSCGFPITDGNRKQCQGPWSTFVRLLPGIRVGIGIPDFFEQWIPIHDELPSGRTEESSGRQGNRQACLRDPVETPFGDVNVWNSFRERLEVFLAFVTGIVEWNSLAKAGRAQREPFSNHAA